MAPIGFATWRALFGAIFLAVVVAAMRRRGRPIIKPRQLPRRAVGPRRTGILAMLEPVTGTVLAALILGETIGPIQLLGGVLVIVAGVLLQRAPRAPPARRRPTRSRSRLRAETGPAVY